MAGIQLPDVNMQCYASQHTSKYIVAEGPHTRFLVLLSCYQVTDNQCYDAPSSTGGSRAAHADTLDMLIRWTCLYAAQPYTLDMLVRWTCLYAGHAYKLDMLIRWTGI